MLGKLLNINFTKVSCDFSVNLINIYFNFALTLTASNIFAAPSPVRGTTNGKLSRTMIEVHEAWKLTVSLKVAF